jgi:predicted DNA-binding transcriptional regulator YafY
MTDQDGFLTFKNSDQTQNVEFTYTNWKGETKQRKAYFIEFFMGSNQWHPETQWLVVGIDLEKQARRTFALKDISNIKRSPKL